MLLPAVCIKQLRSYRGYWSHLQTIVKILNKCDEMYQRHNLKKPGNSFHVYPFISNYFNKQVLDKEGADGDQ